MKVSIVVLCAVLSFGMAFGAPSPSRGAEHQSIAPSLSATRGVLASNEVVLQPVVPTELEWFDNPDETLKYDRTPASAVGLTNGGTYRAAVRFTPTYTCTLKAILFYQWDASSNQYAFVFGENTDTTPGAVLDSASYTGSGTRQWKRVNLVPPRVMRAGVDFWACVRATHTAGTYPISCDSGPMIRNRSGFISTGTNWQQIADFGLNYSWNIRAVVSRGVTNAHDVGATKIIVPGTSVNPGSYMPTVRVVNFGTSAENNIPVTCKIDSAGVTVYDRTAVTGTVPPGGRADVVFTPNWNTGPSGNSYRVRFFTGLAGDEDPANDTVKQTTSIMTGQPLMTHDTGYCALSVTCFGAIGYDVPPTDAGVGMRYPKTAASGLFYASFAVANSELYVADHFFSRPANQPVNSDFLPVESLMPVMPPTGDEQFRARYSDGLHPTPKGLTITQNSHQMANPGYDDFVVIAFDVTNNGSSPVTGLHAGIFADFDIGSNPALNTGAADTARRMVYMRQQSTANPTLGVKILAPELFKNLSCVDHARYVYPDSCMTEGQKWRFLNGTIVQRSSNRAYDWSIVTSVGPFDLSVGENYRFAVAFVGGASEAEVRTNADSAQSWYNGNVGMAERPGMSEAQRGFSVSPNPFCRSALVRYNSRQAGNLELSVYDASGSLVEQKTMSTAAGAGSFLWQPRNLARGVYFLDVRTPGDQARTKVLLLD